MFENIGQKIMTFAKVVCVIGIVISLIMGIATLRINILGAFIMLIVGILGSWIGSWTLYAFGQLVDDNEKIRICLSRVNEKLSTILSSQKKIIIDTHTYHRNF